MVILNKENFKSEVIDFDGVVLLDFWAEWCGPCRMLSPIIDEISTSYKDDPKVKFAKLNTDDYPEIAQSFNILGIPNMKFFKSGNLVGELKGLMPKDVIVQKLKDVISS
jgi:thioredoxin 1